MRRIMLATAAVAIGIGSVLVPNSIAGASEHLAEVDVSRYGGADRYATSLLIAEAVAADAGGSLDNVVMVSGLNWTDAVVAAPLAGSLGAALLATPPGELRTDAADFLQRTGVSNAVLIGANSDSGGVGPTVVAGLNRLEISTERISRSDQYETAATVAYRIGTPGAMGSLGSTAIVASGEVFADALVAGAFAATGKHPILLTPPDELHSSAAEYLQTVDVEHVVLMGGTAALSADVESSIRDLEIEVTRLSGATRYDTAVKAAELTAGRYRGDCFATDRAGIARARVPFDSFSAGPLLGRLCAPLLLTDPGAVPDDTAAYLDQIRQSTAGDEQSVDLRVFGGDAAVSQAAIEEYLATEEAPAEAGLTCDVEPGEKPTALLGGRYAGSPAWSPDCGRIAYLDEEEAVWTANPDGSDRVRLTAGYTQDEEAGWPSWSPDGTRIAFSRPTGEWIHDDEPVINIYLINADGTGEIQLTDSIATDIRPTWSPDGEHIAFERQNLDAAQGDIDGGWRDRYVVVIDVDSRNETELRRGRPRETYPSWSPDGQRIAHIAGSGASTMLLDGTDQRSLPIEASSGDHVTWSPAGDTLAFIQTESLEDGRYRVRLVTTSVDGTNRRTIASYSGPRADHLVINRPQWSPDGRSILFERTRNTGGKRQAYVAAVPQ